MKQAKLALTVVAVFAVVGGALAFKARQAEAKVFRNTTIDGVAKCTLQSIVEDYTTATNGNAFLQIPDASFVAKSTATCNTPVSIYVLD